MIGPKIWTRKKHRDAWQRQRRANASISRSNNFHLGAHESVRIEQVMGRAIEGEAFMMHVWALSRENVHLQPLVIMEDCSGRRARPFDTPRAHHAPFLKKLTLVKQTCD